MFGCEESVYICVSHSLSLPFECWSCVSMATLTPGSQCYFFSTQVASLQSLSLSPSLSSILPSHSSSPVLSPTRIASLSSFAIVYQSNKKKTLFTHYLLLHSPFYSVAVSALSPFRTSLHCWHTFTHKHSASETLLLPLCIQTSFSLSSSLLWISLSPVLYKDTSKDSSHCFASRKQEPSSSVV